MQYTQLGKRGPRVSTIGFGAWAIGGMNWRPLRLFMSSIPDGAKRKSPCALSHPACHVSIPGGKTPEQVRENCAASDMPAVRLTTAGS